MAALQPQPAPALPLDEAMHILRELDRALALHLHWQRRLHRTLICGQPPHPNDLAEDAHRHCNFGLWYGGLDPALLAREPGLAGLAAPHQATHAAARAVLSERMAAGQVSPDTYEHFMDLAGAFKQKIRDCQFELVQRVCSVDHLTGAWNRNTMVSHLLAEAGRALRSGHPCAICLLDIDHFKSVNDRHGHPAGDRVLREVARYLKQGLRAYDSLFRYGGEEFLVCLPNTPIEYAESLLNRLREGLPQQTISLAPETRVQVTASFGVAALEPGEDINLAIERADHALLCAKSQGRDRVCIWHLSDA